MKKIVSVIRVVSLCVLMSMPYITRAQGMQGYWIDTLKISFTHLRLVLQVEQHEGMYSVNAYSIDQTGDEAIVASNVLVYGDSLKCAFKSIRASFALRYDSINDEYTGVFGQGARYNVCMHRIDSMPKVERPQTPVPPYGYIVEDYVVKESKAGPELSGTLTMPIGQYKAAVVLVAGSGPNNRNEVVMGHELFKVLADRLTKSGIAVVRYDKRGIGKSKGDYAQATTGDFAEDAKRVLLQMKKDKRFRQVPVGVVGHSEGGLIAEMLAADKQANPDFVVLMAAPVQQCGELLIDQVNKLLVESNVDSDMVEAYTAKQRWLVHALQKYGKNIMQHIDADLEQYKRQLDTTKAEWKLWADFSAWKEIYPKLDKWTLDFINIDPKDYVTKMRCDVLYMVGDKDVQVLAEKNANMMYEYLPQEKRDKLGQKMRVIVYIDRNHLFQTCTTGMPYEYGYISETIGEDVMMGIAKWILGDR